MKTGIFRNELPGERKSIINLLMTGYLVVISILGYMAFYLSIQMGQADRIIHQLQPAAMTVEEINVVKERLSMTVNRLSNEVKWIALLGGLFSLIGGIYTYNLVVRPLRKLVVFAETGTGASGNQKQQRDQTTDDRHRGQLRPLAGKSKPR